MDLPILTPPDPAKVPNFYFPIFWGSTDPDQVTSLAKAIIERVEPGYHFADNFLSWSRNNSMLEDGPFIAAWQGSMESEADIGIIWRRYVLACAAYHAVHLDGDFVECGCYRGVAIKTVVDYLGGPALPRTFWGYDLFEHTAGMEHLAMADHGPGLAEEVRKKFAAYPRANIVQGGDPRDLGRPVP
jgi:O-methyltransferase